jgi:hypothetical protein
MLEHGLPVIVNRDDATGVTTSLGENEPLLIACDTYLEARLQAGLIKGPCGSRASKVAMDFVSALHCAMESRPHSQYR